jgi:hypothetical protein
VSGRDPSLMPVLNTNNCFRLSPRDGAKYTPDPIRRIPTIQPTTIACRRAVVDRTLRHSGESVFKALFRRAQQGGESELAVPFPWDEHIVVPLTWAPGKDRGLTYTHGSWDGPASRATLCDQPDTSAGRDGSLSQGNSDE